MKRYFIVLLIVVLMFTGCSSSKSASFDNDVKADFIEESVRESDFGGKSSNTGEMKPEEDRKMEDNIFENSKIIKHADLNLETLEFEKSIQAIEKKTEELEGYIENSDISGTPINHKYYNRNAHFVLRIPKKNYDIILHDLSTIANVVNKSESAENVTLRYYDSKARIENLKIEEGTLKGLLEKADNMKDIIIIEERLSELRYEIESLQTDLRNLDHLVDYTTIYVNLREVEKIKEIEIKPKTLGEKIKMEFNHSKEAVGEFYEDASVFFLGGIPKLIIIIPVILVIYILIRLLRMLFRKIKGKHVIRKIKKKKPKDEKDKKE